MLFNYFTRRLAPVAPLALLLACQPEHPAGLPATGLAALRGTWLLLPESSRADTLVYRRNTYRFKYLPGGRPGFQLRPAGQFTRFDPAPGGGLLAEEGTWTETSTGRLLIHLPGLEPPAPDYELEVLSYKDDLLKLRRLRERPSVEVIRQP
jgi:hypothetical protein